MKQLSDLKKIISFNFWAIIPWLAWILFFWCYYLDKRELALGVTGSVMGFVVAFALVLFMIPVIFGILLLFIDWGFKYRIKNKFILENRFYNVFLLVSYLLYIPFAGIIIYLLFLINR